MDYFNITLDNICKGLARPRDVKRFLDELLNLVCEDGFSEKVVLIFSTIKRFEDKVFRYEETSNHVIKDLVFY